MNSGIWGFLGAVSGALVAVLVVAGGIRNLLTGIRKDLIETVKARLEVEKARLEIEKLRHELEKDRARIVQPTTEEVEEVRTSTAIHRMIHTLTDTGDKSLDR